MADKAKPGVDGESLDRVAYLKKIRQELLVKLGLPKDTRPEQVSRLIEIKNTMDAIKKKQ